MSARMVSIAVVATGSAAPLPKLFTERAAAVGRMVSDLGCNLITGGGQGGMALVAQAFCEAPYRVGRSIGVLPGKVEWGSPAPLGTIGKLTHKPKENYPNQWVEVIVHTHLPGGSDGTQDPKGPDSRNILNIASADILVALRGGGGTQAELELALALSGKPVFVLLGESEQIGIYQHAGLTEKAIPVVAEVNALRSLIEEKLTAFFALPRPSFATLNGYYSTDPASIHACSMTFPNTCAIRMSEALVKAVPDIKAKFAASGLTLCPHKLMRGAEDLAGVLKRADVFGVFNAGFSAPGYAPGSISGKKGLVAYIDIPTFPQGQGHIDLWDGSAAVGEAYWDARTIWFWTLS